MSAVRVLVTGFGAFPGVARNYSADLAVAVCAALNAQRSSHARISANAAELTVAWQTVSEQLVDLYDENCPNLAIHFGVCRSVTGLALEQRAHNSCAQDLDARGNPPASEVVLDGASNVLKTRLSVTTIIADCAPSGIDIAPSDDAGRYLCNAAYYTSLSLAARQSPPSDALFIHLPDTLTKDAANWPGFVQAAQGAINAAIRQLPTPAVNLNT